MGKFASAIGVMELKAGKLTFELKPRMGDNKKMRAIMIAHKNDTVTLMDRFDDFMFELIKREYPEEPDNDIKTMIDMHSISFFEQVLMAFGWANEEDIKKAKKDVGEVKN